MSIPLIDYILDLFRNPAAAAQFVADPDGSFRDAGLPNVTSAQLQAVAATAAPAGALLGNGDPVMGLQRAVADHHSIASPFSPTTTYAPSPTFAPETNTQAFSNNDTNTEFLSPDQSAGANAQTGAFNLGFGDITLGDKTTTTQTATDGAVIVNGDNEGEVQTVNDVETGDHSPVIVGNNNDVEDESTETTTIAGDDVIQDNEGPVISEVDMSGGTGGAAVGGDSLIGIGSGANQGGSGGDAGSIVIVESDNDTTTNTQTVNAVEPVILEPTPAPVAAQDNTFAAVEPTTSVVQESPVELEPQVITSVDVSEPVVPIYAPVAVAELPTATDDGM
ncbi:MAG: IniB N-terminal domain-containing protein [Mycobacterium sp.]